MQPISEIVVKQIAEYRHQSGMTLRELAHEIGYSHTYISRVESRRITPSKQFISEAALHLVTKTEKKDVGNSGFAGKSNQI